MPYMTGFVKNIEKPLFLRKFAVPFWALSYCFGKNPMFWYRLEASIGRHSLLRTTIKSAEKLPQHLSADEKHTRLLGEKTYIATTAGSVCILGANVSESASGEDLQKAYSVFKEEAACVNPEYQSDTVNTDGWLPTQNAWKKLFPGIVYCPASYMFLLTYVTDHVKNTMSISWMWLPDYGIASRQNPKGHSHKECGSFPNGLSKYKK